MTDTCSVERCENGVRSRGWCSKHYERWRRHGDPLRVDPPGRLRRPPEERFWPKVNTDGPLPTWAPFLGPCWLWTSQMDFDGYGTLKMPSGRLLRVHRFSYEINVGPIPGGLVIDHLCRVRHCVNPAHLEAVTALENWRRGFAPSAVAARKKAA